MTNVKCGCTITVLLCQTQSMKQCKTQTVHGFAQNVTFSISQTLFSMNSLTWKVKIGLTYLQEVMTPSPLKNSFISGLKFSSININSIRGKKLELLAFIDFHQSQILAIQETKIDNSILTSELFPESFPYSVYRKDRTLNGGGVMLLVHKDIPHMPLTELDNDSESVWVELFVNKKTHFVASWYRPPVDGHLPVSDNGNDLLNSLEKFDNLFREQLDKIKNINKGNKPPLIHVLGDFNFRDIVWPDRLSKSGSSLSQTEGQILIDIIRVQTSQEIYGEVLSLPKNIWEKFLLEF